VELGSLNQSVLTKLKEWKNSPLQFVKECIGATPTEQQIQLLQNVVKEKRITIRSGHGCHAKGTIIHMYPYGFKAVEDVEVGDQLMGDDNTPRNVLELHRGREKFYRITYSDKTYYDVNASHKLALVCINRCSGYNIGDKIIIPVKEFITWPANIQKRFAGYKVAIEYPEQPVIIPPYILGLWLGDGTSLRPELTNTDNELIGMWQLFAQANGCCFNKVDTNRYSISRGEAHKQLGLSNPVKAALSYYNLIGNKHIPKEYLFTSRTNRLKLLAGLIDTDGCGRKSDTFITYSFTSISEDLANDVVFLCQSCGMHATKRVNNSTRLYNNNYITCTAYEVLISQNTDQIPCLLERKKAPKIVNKRKPNLRFGITISELSYNNYYGFELDKNHLYILGDFTVTHNTGKDACVSWVILWFMTTRSYAKVVATAPTNRQLRDILIAEISKWLRQSTVAEEFVVLKDIIYHKEAPKEWWVRFISPSVRATKEEQAETLAGLHGDHLLIVIDEASGVPDPTFIPLEGAMTQADNKVILIGNMTKNTGYYYDTHFHATISTDWCKLHWDSRKSTNVDKSMPEYFAKKYGIESNVYRIRVEGNPPLQDDTTLIPLWAAQQCIGNEFEVAEDEPLYLGVDVARYGDDSSIILPRRGMKIFPWETFNKLNTIDLGGFINQTYQELDANGCAIDVIGVGAGVADWLQKHNMKNLYMVNVANASSDIEKYDRLRDELWCKVRDNCILGIYSFPDTKVSGEQETLGNMLANELASVRYDFNKHGGFKVESKKDMKARGVMSPNIADALCLTEYFSNRSTKVFAKNKPEYKPRNYRNSVSSGQSWMM
jgi:hypothetical protein